MSAAAFIQGLLDLEGSSLTPILVSLVTKNASMLDAFGKVRHDLFSLQWDRSVWAVHACLQIQVVACSACMC
jgi:hypothetical protein